MTALYFGVIVPTARWTAICTISVVACCGCSDQKTSAEKSGYEPAVEVPKSADSGRTQVASSPMASSVSDSSSRRSDVSEMERVQDDVRSIQTAVYDGNVEVVIGYTHPKIIELLGGQENAKVEFSALLSKLQSGGMKLESFAFPTPPTFMKSDASEFVIVPTLSVISTNAARVESLNYQVGNRKIGASNWTYIEGSRLNKQNVKDFLPDFPADYEFPKFYRKKL
jgi:hypothetical protein